MFSRRPSRLPVGSKPSPGAAGGDELGPALAAARQEKEAHKLLSEVYNWFTEGFDTKDLQEAKALLEQLAEAAR